ncbi:Permease of the drug/metabolite transporter (DMT) superfamily [Noviherbaspirillum humi]|uniref:Permease of the drug/metabolite transporter (DMT) superfamily n=1 Tax=Noviherbaspirillum humi TaxID=1688639 RepID=A0A239DT37_9BURK|nr:DMT family transporter [Noviherbaspirillum humi]SNS34714.1 Permease of the drug/metabolite transporter (DMT) superfamily [Noviherbaspirillum humi]
MKTQLTPSTALLLAVPPLLWAGNAIVGRLLHDMVPPITLNLLRWAIALVLLAPLAAFIYRPGSGLLTHWRRFSVLGLLGIGLYNALQYLALQSSTPINVTLVAASMPVWMLLIGWLFFGARVSRRQTMGAALSMAGVLIVLSRGQWQQLLSLRLVPGDIFMVLATIAWSIYSWLLGRPGVPDGIRNGHWASFLAAQVTYGVAWSAVFAAGEWSLGDHHVEWGWPLAAALAYVAIGPAIIAFRCWGVGVQRVGPNIAAFFNNLTPLFAAILSSAILGEMPHAYHAVAFLLIVGGIVLSSRS